MIRIIGAALVIASTASIGLAGVWRLRAHVNTLSAILTCLDLMESEICSKLTPMRDVLEEMAEEAPERVRGFFRGAADGMAELGTRSFYAIWTQALKNARNLRLREEEAQCLGELGLSLGRYDVREQAESISRVRRRMERYLDAAEEQRDRDSKLHAFFGVASGLFAVIILL